MLSTEYFFKFNLELKIIGQLVTKFENNIIVKYEWIKHKKENKLKVRLLTCKDFLSPTVQSYAVYCHAVFCFVLFFGIILNQPLHLFLVITKLINISSTI